MPVEPNPASRFLITGGAGFVGSVITTTLTKSGHSVLVYDNFSHGREGNLDDADRGLLEIVEGDILDLEQLRKAFENFSPSHVIHLAALHYIPYCEANPSHTLAINVIGTRNVVSMLRRTDCELLFTSSASVYAPITVGSMAETSPIGPGDVYGFSKSFGEQLVRRYSERYKIVRLFNTYGQNDLNPHLIPHILAQYRLGVTIELGNPDNLRDYIHVQDAADAFISVLLKGKNNEIYNVGTGESYSVRDVANLCIKMLCGAAEIKFLERNRRRYDVSLWRADTAKIMHDTGWRPKVNFSDGLRATVSVLASTSLST